MTFAIWAIAASAVIGVIVRIIGGQLLTGALVTAATLGVLAIHRVGMVFARNQGRHAPRQVAEAKRREAAAAYERLGDTQAWEPVSPR